jgi:K+-transporting ATPase ATPase C chain
LNGRTPVKTLLQSVRAVLVLTLLTGVLYPAAVLATAHVLFREKSLGSRVQDRGGTLRGSALIGQAFSRPEYLWPRPSLNNYDATQSGGSNVSPVGSAAITRILAERDRLKAANPDAPGDPPLDLVTMSASGLDPDVSLEAALWQAPRIARARGTSISGVRRLIETLASAQGRTFGVLGEPRVNVLEFNLELDKDFPIAK